MSFWGDAGGFFDDEDDDDAVNNRTNTWEVGRDGLIFLIDATDSMLIKSDDVDTSTLFQLCLRCARNVLMSKIISRDRDLVGIIFYGTSKQQNPSDFASVYEFQALDMPDAQRILQIEDLEKDLSEFPKDYGSSVSYSMADALWACSNMFASSTYTLGQKRVLLFTSTDDPHLSNAQLKKQAIKKANDLADLGIDLQLMHMTQGDTAFDLSKFYRDLLDEDDYNQQCDPSEKFDELLTRVRMKEQKKRATNRLPFQMAGGLTFGVSVYTMNRAATKASYVKVDSKTNEEIRCVTKYLCRSTGAELLPTDMKCYQEFGGAKVVYEKEEVDKMKSLVEPGFHLLGFKPRSSLKIYYHVKPASFIYPDETSYNGSTNLFALLLKRCLAKNVTPLCVLVSRASVPPRFVALLPQQEEFDENRVQCRPPGFHVIYLPYSDDIRKVNFETKVKASDEQIDKAKAVIGKLKIKYNCDMFENPSIQKFYRCLEAFALDRDEVEQFHDLTLPNTVAMEKKTANEIRDFKELVFPDDYDSNKRKATSATGAAAKKTKVSETPDIEEVARKGNLNKLTVAVMKGFCQTNQIKSASNKKADFVKAISGHFAV